MELPPSKRRRISGSDADVKRSQVIDVDGSDEEVETREELQDERVVRSKYIEESKVALRSIRQLRADVEKKAYPGEFELMSMPFETDVTAFPDRACRYSAKAQIRGLR
jgi:hypothetical protein